MSTLTVLRSPGRTWLTAVISVPFLVIGLDLLLLPRLFPQYVRRLDLLADEMGLNRIASTGPEEPWGLIFLLAGGGLLTWALKDLLFPAAMLTVDDEGAAFTSVLGPGGGQIVVPRREILEAAPAVLLEGSERVPAVGVRLADPSRMPSSPWGAVWADGTLFLRTAGWTESPARIATALSSAEETATPGYEVDLSSEPPTVITVDSDPTRTGDTTAAYQARSRAYVGGVLALAGVILLVFLWIAGTDPVYFLPALALFGAGGWLFIDGYRRYLETA